MRHQPMVLLVLLIAACLPVATPTPEPTPTPEFRCIPNVEAQVIQDTTIYSDPGLRVCAAWLERPDASAMNGTIYCYQLAAGTLVNLKRGYYAPTLQNSRQVALPNGHYHIAWKLYIPLDALPEPCRIGPPGAWEGWG